MPYPAADDELSVKEHWEDTWKDVRLPRSIDIQDRIFGEYHRLFTDLFRSYFSSRREGPRDLLEVGCAASAWMPYFHDHHGFRVHGVDYSPHGVDQANRNLTLHGIPGEVVLGDVMKDGQLFDKRFDVVVSFGLVEHFRSPDRILGKMAEYLRSGGLIITGIPNLRGLFGRALRAFRHDLYAIHHPMDVETLQRFHEKAGLAPHVIPGYVGGIDLKMVSSVIVREEWPRLVRASVATATHWINPAAYRLLRLSRIRSLRRFLAPDILVIYRKL